VSTRVWAATSGRAVTVASAFTTLAVVATIVITATAIAVVVAIVVVVAKRVAADAKERPRMTIVLAGKGGGWGGKQWESNNRYSNQAIQLHLGHLWGLPFVTN
jgi:hypothetical protein